MRGELLYPGMRVGLFGGSFNPAHAGHLHVAREAKKRLGLDRVWWMVSPQNPLKDTAQTDAYWRRMADVWALADDPDFVVTDVERRLGTSFTQATVSALVTRHPGVRFVWVMGADNLQGFHRWRGWSSIMNTLPVAVVARPGDALRARLGVAARRFANARVDQAHARALVAMQAPAWLYLTTKLHPASSTELRTQRERASSPTR